MQEGWSTDKRHPGGISIPAYSWRQPHGWDERCEVGISERTETKAPRYEWAWAAQPSQEATSPLTQTRKKLKRNAQIRPEGPGRPNKSMDLIHLISSRSQMILSSFRWITMLIVRKVGLKRLEGEHKKQTHPSSISTNKNENKMPFIRCNTFNQQTL